LDHSTYITFFRRCATALFYRPSIDYHKIKPVERRYNVGYCA